MNNDYEYNNNYEYNSELSNDSNYTITNTNTNVPFICE